MKINLYSITGCIFIFFIVSCINSGSGTYFTAHEIMTFAETDPVNNSGDAADDCAIWINRADITSSRVVGTDKKGGLVIYDLQGNMTAYLGDGLMNNVDLRYDFNLSGNPVCIIAASNRSDNSLAIYKMNEVLLYPENVSGRIIHTRFSDAYGICMYRSTISGFYYVFVTDHSGLIEQWRLYDVGNGSVDAAYVRTLMVDSTAEGCVAFDEKGLLFVAEEHGGIWMFDAEPSGDIKGRKIISIEKNYLTPELEGLTIIRVDENRNYLAASVQGNDSFAIFRISGTFEWAGSFRLVLNTGKAVDKVTHTDGIDAWSGAIGPDYPDGIFVVQDDENTPSGLNQNFKYIRLGDIISGLGL